jgi:BirA family biotin operon repressor/biotin-[acetyl-CoA-carboxylase] ligase
MSEEDEDILQPMINTEDLDIFDHRGSFTFRVGKASNSFPWQAGLRGGQNPAPTMSTSPNSTFTASRAVTVGAANWTLVSHETVTSTNDLARELPPWSAVRADSQTAGRGRFGRSFVSDVGGLWLSAILPAPGDASRWAGFSLMVGHHLLLALRELKVPQARLRWPNDLMSGRKKLAGLLIEQGARQKLTVGIGMNVQNAPWNFDPSLTDSTARLADISGPVPSLDALAVSVLDRLEDAYHAMLAEGLNTAIRALNTHWSSYRVEITLTAGEIVAGKFLGLDEAANLRIMTAQGHERRVLHQHVARLKELF